jgi:CheY-like chemotaxis protein
LRGGQVNLEEAILSRTPMSSPAPLRVLVSEGAGAPRTAVAGFLERAGNVVVHAPDSAAVLKLVTREGFDLIVLDFDAVGLDVVATTARIRAQERQQGGHVPIVVLISQTGKRERQACLAAGADACFNKPFERAAFVEVMNQLLDAHPPASRNPTAADLQPGGAELDEDARLFRRLQAALIETTSGSIEKLRAAVAASEAMTVHRMAQGLKGALIVFKADQAAVRAAELEESGARGDFREARRLLPMLEAEMSSALAKARSELFEVGREMRPGSTPGPAPT